MRRHNHAADSLANILGEQHGVFRHLRSLTERFEDRYSVTYRDALPEKILKHTLNQRVREHFWNQILNHFGIGLCHPIAEVLGILPAEQFVCVPTDHFGEVSAQHANIVHHRITPAAGKRGTVGGNPKRC